MESTALPAQIWIAHSEADASTAREFARILRRDGFGVSIAEETFQPGDNIEDIILKSIDQSDVILFLLSRRSSISPWVEAEMAAALARQRRRGNPLVIPVLLDDDAEVPDFAKNVVYMAAGDADPEYVSSRLRTVLKRWESGSDSGPWARVGEAERIVNASMREAVELEASQSRGRILMLLGALLVSLTMSVLTFTLGGVLETAPQLLSYGLLGFGAAIVGVIAGAAAVRWRTGR